MADNVIMNLQSENSSSLKERGNKKDLQIIKTSLSIPPDTGEPLNIGWCQLLQSVITASCFEDQMEVIKQISSHLLEADKGASSAINLNYIDLAADLYLNCPLKHPAKYALAKTFSSVGHHVRSACLFSLKEGLGRRIKAAIGSSDLQLNNIASNALMCCYDSSQLGKEVVDSMFLDVLQYLDLSLHLCHSFLSSQNTPMQKVEVSKAAHTISRITITALQNLYRSSLIKSELEKPFIRRILQIALCMVSSAEVPLDTRTNFGFVVVLSLEYLEGSEGWMQLLGASNITPMDDMSHLCICSGLLSGLRSDQLQLVHPVEQMPIIACILEVALFINERSVQESNTILALWRVIQQLTRILSSNPFLVPCLKVTQMEGLLNHLWGLLDHYMDTVRHLAGAILENILQLKHIFLSSGLNLKDKMLEAFLVIPETKRSRYVILATLTSHLNTSEIMERVPDVINNLLVAMQLPAMSSHVSGAFVAMAAADFKRLSYQEWSDMWVMPLFHVMQNCNMLEIPALEEALTKVMKMSPKILNEVIPDFSKESNLSVSKLRLLLTCMRIGRRLGVVSWEDQGNKCLWFGILPIAILQSALHNQCDEIRLSALGLIVETSRSTESLNDTDFELLKLFLKYNVSCETPSFRQQTLSFLMKLFYRMKNSAHSLNRLLKQRKYKEEEWAKIFQNYRSFLQWILIFCFGNLGMGSNHSRKTCSLKILSIFVDVLKDSILFTNDDYQSEVWCEKNALTLIGVILVDSFEENKAMATKIFSFFPMSTLDLNDDIKLLKLFQSGCLLASSNHPADCVAAAYLIEVCSRFYSKILLKFPTELQEKRQPLDIFDILVLLKAQLEEETKIAQQDIFQAASSRPMYGTLFCIRHMLHLVPDFSKVKEKALWRNLMGSLIDLCFKIDSVVSPVVNSSSPEGHLPMDFNSDSFLLDSNTPFDAQYPKVTAQMVLLCSWRTVKEVSLLLGELSDCCPILPDSQGLLSEGQVIAIGVHLTTLLEKTKHRGAFEQAYVGFNLLASCLWRHSNKTLQELPQKWLNELMDAIQSNEPAVNRLCATRRSAGVPFLVQALVSAELTTVASLKSLQVTMSQLLACASDKKRHVECRTHALNILRALFRHAPLAEHVAPYISEGVIVALSGFRGKTWAERNSATLLFSSLMTRIFGVRRSREEISSRNKMTGRVFFHRYPDLYEFLLLELQRSVKALTSGDVAELAMLHPILLLIARLYPSSLEGTDTPMQLSTFVPLVQECASNTVLKTRVLAAKATVPLITANVFVKYLECLFKQLVCTPHCNYAHGLALQIVHILNNSSTLNDDQSSVLISNLETWVSMILQSLKVFLCNPVQEVLLQILEIIIANWFSLVPPFIWMGVQDIITKDILHRMHHRGPLETLGQQVLEVRATRVILQLLILLKHSDSKTVVLFLLKHPHYELVHETLVTLERIMRGDDKRLMTDTIEEFVPNLTDGGGHWSEQLSLEAVQEFCSSLCDSKMIGETLAVFVETNDDLQGSLALQVLAYFPPSSWSSGVDMTHLLKWCQSPYERTACAALACFSCLLKLLIDTNESIIISEDWWKLLKSFCSEEKSLVSRMAAVNFLLQHRQLLGRQHVCLSDKSACELWICAFMLIADDNSEVRSRAALLCQSELTLVPQKALECLMDEFVGVMGDSPAYALAMLTALALGPLPNSSNFEIDEERVFDKGETNMYIEREHLSTLLCQHILSLVAQGTDLDLVHCRWIWEIISGMGNECVTSRVTLFGAIREHSYRGLCSSKANILRSSPVVCSLYLLSKVEHLYSSSLELKQYDCFPFNSEKLFGSVPKYVQSCVSFI